LPRRPRRPHPIRAGRTTPQGLGEQLLRGGPNGAVAYIGCNTGSQPCGLTLLDGFVRAVSQASPEASSARKNGPTPPRLLGDCWSQAITHYYDKERLATLAPSSDWYPASIFFQGMKFLLLGDPTLPLPAAEGADEPAR
jgi:hypothetical protein